jgi:hypothetical protein
MWRDKISREIRPPIKVERSRVPLRVYEATPLVAHVHAHAEVNSLMLMA